MPSRYAANIKIIIFWHSLKVLASVWICRGYAAAEKLPTLRKQSIFETESLDMPSGYAASIRIMLDFA